MVLQLKQLFNIPGEKSSFEFEITEEKLKEYVSYYFVSPIAIHGTLVNRAGAVSLDYSVQFTMNQSCDRCLSEFNREYTFDFNHLLVRFANEDVDLYIECPDDTLDLTELAMSDILLQLPTKILCKVDCKGLCQFCGKNKNTEECNCEN